MSARVEDAVWFVSHLDPRGAAGASDEDLAVITPLLESRRVPRGQVLFSAGSVPDGVWAVRRGLVELCVGAGRRRRIVEIAQRGDLIGVPYALLDRPADLTARTLTPVEALFLPGHLDAVLGASRRLARLWLSRMSAQLIQTRRRVVELLGRTLTERVARLLLADSEDGRLAMSQAGIAQMLAVQRSSVNRVLRSFEDDGVLRLRYANVEILDREALRDIAYPDGDRAAS